MNRRQAEFGDFQTPLDTARSVCALLSRVGVRPATVIEPACGKGSFLRAAGEAFPHARNLIGIEINPEHVNEASAAISGLDRRALTQIRQEDFFSTDWATILGAMPSPILAIGNPPWVTNSALSSMGSSNFPAKSNFQDHAGIEAITGRSNFDISEWMLIRLFDLLAGRDATVAMLCKTSVARRALYYAWSHDLVGYAEMFVLDASAIFGVSVDACLLLAMLAPARGRQECTVWSDLAKTERVQTFGLRDERLIADVTGYDRYAHLEGGGHYRWRSGIKHDCSRVMELVKVGHQYRNGYRELVDLEDAHLFPMLKSSDLANGRTTEPKRWMIVTQKAVGQSTELIRQESPLTWSYLMQHSTALDQRASAIYKHRPRFSVFGVGDYTFAPWKVAISGFYKGLNFTAVGSSYGKPVVFDDTCYFLPCATQSEAELLARMLATEAARDFYSALVFWDSKRPITVGILERLDLCALARETGHADKFNRHGRHPEPLRTSGSSPQERLFETA
jgi:hypothetical protein